MNNAFAAVNKGGDWVNYFNNPEINKEADKAVIYNALGLSPEQKKIYKNTDLKKSVNRKQYSKYSMIKKLERLNKKRAKHEKDYYKLNPQMQLFGDLNLDCSSQN